MKTIILFIFFVINCQAQSNSIVIKLEENCSLELKREVFVAKEHKIDYQNKFVVGIDGVPLFGSDGELPKFKLTQAVLKIGDKIYNLQVDNMYNPWYGTGVNEKFFRIIHDSPNDHILKAQFSDGAGSYAAEWLIEWNSSIRGILTKDEIIIESYFEK